MSDISSNLVSMARAAQHDERLSDGALYGKLADAIERLSRPPCGTDPNPHSCATHREECTQIVDASGNSCPYCVIDAAEQQIERLTRENKAASDFMRVCIEAVGYKSQPPEGFELDTEALGLHVISEIERWKVEADERDRYRAALERIAANDRMTGPHPVGPAMGAGVNQGLEWNAKIAREALRPADQDTSEAHEPIPGADR